ncbi:MAG: hypothetical protein KBS39_00615 [Lachnospiraceae bacterium]|nr:hypothetical protein [Candidatus Hippenecus merdae]
MKKSALLLTGILVLMLTACVKMPGVQSEVLDIGPDMEGKEGVNIEFDAFSSEVMEGINDPEPYSFVTRVSIEGTGTTKDGYQITAAVGTYSPVEKEDIDAFSAVLMKSMGTTAGSELKEYEMPARGSFGNFCEQNDIRIEFYADEDLDTENAQPYFVYEHKAGEPIALDPDQSAYEADYYKRKDILERSL